MDAEEIDLNVGHALWEADELIVDVRSPAEYAHEHIAGAINVPLRSITFQADDLPAGQVVTVCSMGNRSRQGADAFARTGRTALSLRGGTQAWRAAGLPVVRGDQPGERQRPPWWRRLFTRG